MKKIIKAVLWIMLITSFLHVIAEARSARKVQPTAASTVETFDYAAASFATAYAKEYLTWRPKDMTKETRLRNFESSQTGIIRTTMPDTGKTQTVRDAWVLGIEKTDGSHLNVRVMADVISGTTQRYLEMSVPLIKGGDGYGVYKNPNLRVYQSLTVNNQPPKYGDGASPELIIALRPALEGFFKAFLVAEMPEEISTFVKGTTKINPLGGAWQYRKLVKYDVFKDGIDESKIVVAASIEVQDPQTATIMSMDYTLKMVQENGKYLITNLK